MNYRLLLAIVAASTLTLATARAQDDEDDDDQEFDYFAYFTRAHSNMTFGFRATQGAKVKFGNLGSIPVTAVIPDFSAANANATRTYNNGYVGGDALRPEEQPGGNATLTGDGRYQIRQGEVDGNNRPAFDANNNQITYVQGDYVAYVPGATRNYGFATAGQLANNTLTFNQYSTTSEGAAFDGKRTLSAGVELQAERLLTDPTKRIRLSLVAGVSLNGINSKKSGTVSSTLHILTDTYSFTPFVTGTVLPTVFPYDTTSALSSATYPDSVGIGITGAKEVSPVLSTSNTGSFIAPTRTEADDPDGAEVTGVWEIKGSYLVLRFGPELSASLTPNLSFNASAGVAGAFVGANYTATETAILTAPNLVNNTISTGALTAEVNRFLPGYYANVDASWAVNERTGFFAGLSYEAYGDFTTDMAGRTAKIDLGGAASVRGGINIKF